MSDGVPPRVSSTAGSTWFSRHPRLRTAARTFAAAWCGSFVAAAAATLTNPAELVDDNIRVILFLVLAFFSLVVAIGIVRWNEFLPRYGLVIGSAVSLWLIPEEW